MFWSNIRKRKDYTTSFSAIHLIKTKMIQPLHKPQVASLPCMCTDGQITSSHLREDKCSSSGTDSAGSFKVASVEKKIKRDFHAALWVNARLQGECLSPLLTVASSRALCEL